MADTFTGLRFVLINAAVMFVPAMITDINGLFSYRGVTAGQSLGDAATVDFVWEADGLKCLAPVNIRGTRNSIGDLFEEWTRRSRLGAGMTPGSDVPLGEEVEMYDVEFLTTGNVLKRTMRVIPGGGQAAIVLPLAPRYAPVVSGNNIIGPMADGSSPLLYTAQQISNSGGWVEATLIAEAAFQSVHLTLVLSNEIGIDIPLTQYYDIVFGPITTDGPQFRITYGNTLLYTEYLPGVTMARIRLVVVGSETRFYWDYMGPGSVPFYVATVPLPLPLTPRFSVNSAAKVLNIYVGNNISGPSVIYSAEQQTADGFTPNVSTIRTRIYQISSIVGRGHMAQADL